MPEEKAILRSRRIGGEDLPADLTIDPINGHRWPDSPLADVEMDIDIVRGQTDASDAKRPDETVVPSMDIQLIEPVGCPDAELEAVGRKSKTWGIDAVGARDCTYTGEGITVAILDSGIDGSHPAFEGIELIQRDFTDQARPDTCPDDHGHGTHCAGIIFGREVAGQRIGIAPGVQRAVIGKIFGKNEAGTSARVYEAIDWAADQGAHVISMSIAFNILSYVIRLRRRKKLPRGMAITKALSAYRDNLLFIDRIVSLLSHHPRVKPLLIAAAGNDSQRDRSSDHEIDARMPAAVDGVVAAGALRHNMDRKLTVSRFSNTGVDVVAPGSAILSARPGGDLRYRTGTSMAGAHVAGVAALWAEKLMLENLHLNPAVLRARLVGRASTASLQPGFGPKTVGAGLVQAPRR